MESGFATRLLKSARERPNASSARDPLQPFPPILLLPCRTDEILTGVQCHFEGRHEVGRGDG
jgi:hypothetical protein